jgi:formamidopyrimidine-DNA glycosylase
VPELPDVELYLAALRPRLVGHRLVGIRLGSPFLLRSVEPSLSTASGRTVVALSRLGKRIVVELDGELFLVLHLMIAGRLRWRPLGTAVPKRLGLAAFDFDDGTLLLTEAGSKKRAALFVVGSLQALAEHDPGGLEPLTADLSAFREAVRRENRTLKRALTDPRILSGIGNAGRVSPRSCAPDSSARRRCGAFTMPCARCWSNGATASSRRPWTPSRRR